MNQRNRRALIASVLMAFLLGCKAAPAPSVGFADPSVLKSDPTVPFNKFWQKPGVDWKSYDKIYVADVNTSYMLKQTFWQKGERQGDIERDVQKLAAYTRDSISKAFREDPHHRFQVVNDPTHDPHTLVLELALVEVVPSKVVLNALGYAPFFIGTGISVVRTVAQDKSSAAFEARHCAMPRPRKSCCRPPTARPNNSRSSMFADSPGTATPRESSMSGQNSSCWWPIASPARRLRGADVSIAAVVNN